jgi:hypothetical protein
MSDKPQITFDVMKQRYFLTWHEQTADITEGMQLIIKFETALIKKELADAEAAKKEETDELGPGRNCTSCECATCKIPCGPVPCEGKSFDDCDRPIEECKPKRDADRAERGGGWGVMGRTKDTGALAVYPAYKFWKDLALAYIGEYGHELVHEYSKLDKAGREKMAIKAMQQSGEGAARTADIIDKEGPE